MEKWFSDVKAGPKPPPIAPPAAALTTVVRETLEDRVQLPRLYLAWLTPPEYTPASADLNLVGQILAGGKNSRLYGLFHLQAFKAAGASQVIMIGIDQDAKRIRSGQGIRS